MAATPVKLPRPHLWRCIVGLPACPRGPTGRGISWKPGSAFARLGNNGTARSSQQWIRKSRRPVWSGVRLSRG